MDSPCGRDKDCGLLLHVRHMFEGGQNEGRIGLHFFARKPTKEIKIEQLHKNNWIVSKNCHHIHIQQLGISYIIV
jgi:hypothetical protein